MKARAVAARVVAAIWFGSLARCASAENDTCADDGACAAEVVLDDVCVRGVEMAPRGAKVSLLGNLTRCPCSASF